MRITALLALLGLLGLMLLGLTGCSDSAQTATVRGVVENQFTGTLLPGVTVQLTDEGGAVVRTFSPTGTAGDFTFENVEPGIYNLVVTGPGLARTVFGPFRVTTSIGVLRVPVAPTAALEIEEGILVPDNGTTTAVAYFEDSTGALVPARVIVNGFGPSDVGIPTVLTGITPGTHDVLVVNEVTDEAVTFRNVAFPTNTIVVLRARGGVVTQRVTVTGNVVNFDTGAGYNDATVRLLLGGNEVLRTTTGSAGAFTLHNVPTGIDYLVEVTSNLNNFVRTLIGPVVAISDTQNVRVDVLTEAQLLAEFGVEPPVNNTTATLVVVALNQNDEPVEVTVAISTFTPVTGTPAIVEGITPGTYTITVQITGTGETVRFENVSLPGGSLTVLRVL